MRAARRLRSAKLSPGTRAQGSVRRMRGSGEERMVTIARRDAPAESLEGIFQAGESAAARGVVLAPPHPLYGGSLEAPVLSELAWAAAQAGPASLRFNWRCVGASAGEPSGDPAGR